MRKVLIADDKAIMRELLKVILREIDIFDVLESSNGVSAVEIFSEHQPDIVFLDINMPEKDGLQTLKEIKLLKPQVFVIMITGHSSIENVKTAISYGANGFIVKPYNSQKIIDLLQTKCAVS
ncbi:MAG: response regulator transcription factor [Gammaproteobacteria bacterium]